MRDNNNIIRVVRCRTNQFGTFGRLWFNDEFIGYTLEPVKRDDNIKPRCIPVGSYWLNLVTVSPKYRFRSPYNKWHGVVPRLMNVTGFDGILIHIGNFLHDTKGCILIAEKCNTYRLYNSTSAYLMLMRKLEPLMRKGVVELRIDVLWLDQLSELHLSPFPPDGMPA